MHASRSRGPPPMPSSAVHAPTLGPDGEPCATCAAPLAGDQRYCLECGTRRGAPRLDPVALARGNAPGVVSGPGASGVAGVPDADDAALPAAALALGRPRVAATAALLVLGFGVIVGIAAGPDSTTSLAAQRRIVVAQNRALRPRRRLRSPPIPRRPIRAPHRRAPIRPPPPTRARSSTRAPRPPARRAPRPRRTAAAPARAARAPAPAARARTRTAVTPPAPRPSRHRAPRRRRSSTSG